MTNTNAYNSIYADNRNGRIAFPLGGFGTGMLGLEGRGGLSHVSLRNRPNIPNQPLIFSALTIKGKVGNTAIVLEGQVPDWKVFAPGNDTGRGAIGKHYGLPRYRSSSFESRFPFGIVRLTDERLPVAVTICGWSPFTPLDADSSSLPVAALEYTLTNTSDDLIELIYSFHAENFMQTGRGTGNIRSTDNGFILHQQATEDKLWEQGDFCASTDQSGTTVNHAWFRGGWFDALTMVWNGVEAGECLEVPAHSEGAPSPGASLFVPLELAAHESRTVRLRLSWYVPKTDLTIGVPDSRKQDPFAIPTSHVPWYAGKFADIYDLSRYWAGAYETLREESERFSTSFYDSSLPSEVVEAVAANLSILKSPTVLRQADGRLWGWEGCGDREGSCHGSCTHVWNYAQAIPHLFPDLERSLRSTELNENQDELGHQSFRASLPIGEVDHHFHAAADGQLGGIMRVYREWRISGDSRWLIQLWPKVKQSLDYCIETWDPDRQGVLTEPHHNTYDIEFWGADSMCSSIYLGALKAAALMRQAIGVSGDDYDALYRKGRQFLESELFNGEYFEQRIEWEGLHTLPLGDNDSNDWRRGYSTEAKQLLLIQGPKYQYGVGCLSDGIIGAWLAEMCGLGSILDKEKVRSHLLSVYKYNFRDDLTMHANPQRSGYAIGGEGGLLLCTWPRGGKLSLPFVYSNEVWTGIEYQVASHLMAVGCVEEGLDIVRTCRDRYDGRVRNPFDEYECGHWYARAMASYGLIQGITGIRYDAVEGTLYVSPSLTGDFRSFLCAADGYGIAGMKGGQPFWEPKAGNVRIERVELS